MIPNWLVDFLKKEWSAITRAPLVMGMVALTVAIVTSFARGEWDRRLIEISKSEAEQARQRAGVYPDFTRFSKLSNKELKDATNEIVRQLAGFQIAFDAMLKSISTARASSTEYDKRDNALKFRFEREFRPLGLALREEILRRMPQKTEIKGPEIGAAALDFGVMVGANPIGDTATYLQYIASLLPD